MPTEPTRGETASGRTETPEESARARVERIKSHTNVKTICGELDLILSPENKGIFDKLTKFLSGDPLNGLSEDDAMLIEIILQKGFATNMIDDRIFLSPPPEEEDQLCHQLFRTLAKFPKYAQNNLETLNAVIPPVISDSRDSFRAYAITIHLEKTQDLIEMKEMLSEVDGKEKKTLESMIKDTEADIAQLSEMLKNIYPDIYGETVSEEQQASAPRTNSPASAGEVLVPAEETIATVAPTVSDVFEQKTPPPPPSPLAEVPKQPD